MTSRSTQPHDEMYGLGANERAILERIRWGPARHLAVRGVRLKMRLQFAGWLQYLIPTPVIVVLGLLGGLLLLLDVQWLTPHLASLGAVEIGRDEYLGRLGPAVARPLAFG